MGYLPNLKEIFGTPSTRWFSNREIEEETIKYSGKGIPGGSEGTLQYEILDAGDGLVWKTVAVWGDLRDFGLSDVEEIEKWFKRIVETQYRGVNLLLREAHLIVSVEYGPTFLFRLQEKEVLKSVIQEHSEE